jgi:hypothetical protein
MTAPVGLRPLPSTMLPVLASQALSFVFSHSSRPRLWGRSLLRRAVNLPTGRKLPRLSSRCSAAEVLHIRAFSPPPPVRQRRRDQPRMRRSSPSSGKTRPMVSRGSPAFLPSSLHEAPCGCRAWACLDFLGAESDAFLLRPGRGAVRPFRRNARAGTRQRPHPDLGLGRASQRLDDCGGRRDHPGFELARLVGSRVSTRP